MKYSRCIIVYHGQTTEVSCGNPPTWTSQKKVLKKLLILLVRLRLLRGVRRVTNNRYQDVFPTDENNTELT